jgi:hypothetical protein
MKFYNWVIVFFVFSCLASCKKSGVTSPVTLVAKWGLVNDSTAYGESYITKTNYVGVPGDYFDFRADGKVYIKEGAKCDTLTYHMVGRDSVSINTFNVNNYPNVIDPFTAHNAAIHSSNFPIFWVTNYRMINLKK